MYAKNYGKRIKEVKENLSNWKDMPVHRLKDSMTKLT